LRGRSSNIVKVCYPEFDLKALIERIRRGAEAISKSLPLRLVILFGSYAKGRHTAASDVDLLVVYEDPKRDGDYGICWDAFGIPQAEILVYTRSEYEGLKGKGALKGIEGEGIVIWGSGDGAPPPDAHHRSDRRQ
jgi:hypothetical protein